MSAIKSLRAMSLHATSIIRLRNNAISYGSRFNITQDWSSTTKRSCTIIPRAIRRNVSGNGSRPNAPCNKAHAPSFQTCRPSTLSFADGRGGWVYEFHQRWAFLFVPTTKKMFGVGRLFVNVTSRHAPCSLLWEHCVADTQEPHLGTHVIIPMA